MFITNWLLIRQDYVYGNLIRYFDHVHVSLNKQLANSREANALRRHGGRVTSLLWLS